MRRRPEESHVACRFAIQGQVFPGRRARRYRLRALGRTTGGDEPWSQATPRSRRRRHEIAVQDASGAYRAVYTVSIGDSIYVIHAFQKKSKAGVATPKIEIDLIKQRLEKVRNEVKNAKKQSS